MVLEHEFASSTVRSSGRRSGGLTRPSRYTGSFTARRTQHAGGHDQDERTNTAQGSGFTAHTRAGSGALPCRSEDGYSMGACRPTRFASNPPVATAGSARPRSCNFSRH